MLVTKLLSFDKDIKNTLNKKTKTKNKTPPPLWNLSRMKIDPFLSPCIKTNSTWIKNLNIRTSEMTEYALPCKAGDLRSIKGKDDPRGRRPYSRKLSSDIHIYSPSHTHTT